MHAWWVCMHAYVKQQQPPPLSDRPMAAEAASVGRGGGLLACLLGQGVRQAGGWGLGVTACLIGEGQQAPGRQAGVGGAEVDRPVRQAGSRLDGQHVWL